ncbi:MAG: integrase, partial [Phenylobacterium sp.]|nr:integrase [Phenylobacterium sp.]
SPAERPGSLRFDPELPHDTADALIEGLAGAMDALVVGDPADPRTDIGPVIDEDARAALADPALLNLNP